MADIQARFSEGEGKPPAQPYRIAAGSRVAPQPPPSIRHGRYGLPAAAAVLNQAGSDQIPALPEHHVGASRADPSQSIRACGSCGMRGLAVLPRTTPLTAASNRAGANGVHRQGYWKKAERSALISGSPQSSTTPDPA